MRLNKFKINKIGAYIKMLMKHPKPIRNLYGTLLVYSGLCKRKVIKRKDYHIHFFPTALSLNYFVNKNSRKVDDEILEIFLKKGGTYIDAGANIGALALKASALVGDAGKVCAIEAHPVTYDYLKQNYALNQFSNYELQNNALGSKKGEIFFSDNNSDDQNHVVSIGKGIPVDMVTLDSITEELGEIDLLKIDVEGFELQVVKGAKNTLKKLRLYSLRYMKKISKGIIIQHRYY